MARVDVLMPVREPAPWLAESLEALTRQSDVDWRLVLVIHGTDSETSAIAAGLGLPLTVCHAAESETLPRVLDLGLASCTAPYVARMDADDVAMPGRLSRTAGWLDDHPEVTVVASRAVLIDAEGRAVGTSPPVSTRSSLIRAMRWRNVLVHSSVTFRREPIASMGGYAPEAVQVEDYDLWLRVLANGTIEMVPDALVQHRVHPAQVTRRRAVESSAAHALGMSRIALARARGESVLAARVRQAAWSGRQATRRWRRG
jgi:glycosyltransferase involved in cell wall biosynthesis